jgi:hypothetical protein
VRGHGAIKAQSCAVFFVHGHCKKNEATTTSQVTRHHTKKMADIRHDCGAIFLSLTTRATHFPRHHSSSKPIHAHSIAMHMKQLTTVPYSGQLHGNTTPSLQSRSTYCKGVAFQEIWPNPSTVPPTVASWGMIWAARRPSAFMEVFMQGSTCKRAHTCPRACT